jgi:DEAD/DEAH box helicase domain-containing protein
MDLSQLLNKWRQTQAFADNVSAWIVTPAVEADRRPIPASLNPNIKAGLQSLGTTDLYSHQLESFEALESGQNVIISTGTASGKTLAYNLRILDDLSRNPKSTAIHLYPTKALAQDQLSGIQDIIQASNLQTFIRPAIYDGDTPQSQRKPIRNTANILKTNPDMLHQAILPHHTNWHRLLSNLRYVVIDEAHIYRGVFGSHFANVLRRLKRVCAFYGAFPQFVLTSATIGNPQELAEKLIESSVHLINKDGSQHGEKQFIIYNPPMVDQQLGIRKSALLTGVIFTKELIENEHQTLIFARTRRTVEMILTYLRDTLPIQDKNQVRGYRSGFLKKERRQIENDFRKGDLKAVVSTSALELGIDIGDLESVILVGYPGSIATTKQRAGRAGRKSQSAMAMLIPTPDALDQYLARHPEYIIDQNPENALIDPDNLSILTQHVLCASFELPFSANEPFGQVDPYLLRSILEFYKEQSILNYQNDKYYFVSDDYPSASVSLRSSTSKVISLKLGTANDYQLIGEIDAASAAWFVHPGAIYLHDAGVFEVQSLDIEKGNCFLDSVNSEYYTIPNLSTSIEDFSVITHEKHQTYSSSYGHLSLKFELNSYKKLRWHTNEVLGIETLSLPPGELETVGFWMSLKQSFIDQLRDEGNWTATQNIYGANWKQIREKIILRDANRCRACGKIFESGQLHVHHIQPFKSFVEPELANKASNLVSLCPGCHSLAEVNVRIRSGLAAASNALRNLAPLLIMCDQEDIGSLSEAKSVLADGLPAILVYDGMPGGLGLSRKLYENKDFWIASAAEAIETCPCSEGCPACVGPVGELGYGGKSEGIALLRGLR